MQNILDHIVNGGGAAAAPPAAEPDAKGRLATAEIIRRMATMGDQISRQGQSFTELPGAQPNRIPELLKDVAEAAGHVARLAAELLAANR